MNHPAAPELSPLSLDAAKAAAAEAWKAVGVARPHESAELHVLGQATYTDDIPELQGTLHAALGLSSKAHARITAIDLAPVRAAAGIVYFHHKGVFDPGDRAVPIAPPQRE